MTSRPLTPNQHHAVRADHHSAPVVRPCAGTECSTTSRRTVMSASACAPTLLNDPAERAALIAAARELVPLLRAHAAETEGRGNLAPEVDAALRAGGFYTLTAPRMFGGREAGVRTVIDVFAELALGCGSSSWVGKIHCGAAFMASLFDDQAREDIWGKDSHAAVSAATNGAASNSVRSAPGGIKVSGEWRYVSGIHQAQWVLLRVVVDAGTTAEPDIRLALLPARDMVITNTWDVAGMEGTGSDSVVVRDAFVPEYRTLAGWRLGGSEQRWQEGERVYNASVSSWLGVSLAGPIIGMAQGALDHVLGTLAGKPITGSTYTDAVRSPSVQLGVADAASLIDTARLHAYRAAADIEAASIEGRRLDVAARARIRMDNGVVMQRCREAMERILDISGTAGFRRSNPLQRFWRDLATGSRTATVSTSLSREIYGRALLGIEEQVTEIV
ncbi:acyl-CoA dehydrogenase family protein [Pseudonocardia xinjiangensis]|uniref:acyl-CoA dehydrogenase family protein n=1 Tax=Pseudonocardia xinjiangensis TaxID=75289 RepID=UPI003D93C17C